MTWFDEINVWGSAQWRRSKVAAGEHDAVEAAAPLLDAIGQKTFIVSETPKAATLVKLSGNFLIAADIESLGEAMALVGKGGIDKRQLTSTLFGAPVYKTYGRLIADGIFEPAGFAAPLGQKDIRLTFAAGRRSARAAAARQHPVRPFPDLAGPWRRKA